MNKLKNFPYTYALVLGLAKSGTAAAHVLLNNNIDVRVNDYKVDEQSPVVQELRGRGAEVIVGSHPLLVLEGIDIVVKNPGIRYDHPIVKAAVQKNIPIITEIELAYNLAQNNTLIGITGSNGKTTTTQLVYNILNRSKKAVQVAGNIGIVASEIAEKITEKDHLLMELSSFQLLGVQSFRPTIAVLLNLYGAHIDYHGSIDAYIEAKERLISRQQVSDYFVYRADDERINELLPAVKAQKVPFSIHLQQEKGAWITKNTIYYQKEKIIHVEDVALVGNHNLENVLAAICVAKLCGATTEAIRNELREFSGVKHRLQFVKEVQGRLFYNDSKATNMLATEKALQSFTKPVILLAGGLDRGETFERLIPSLANVKAIILFGETAPKLAEIARQSNIEVIKRTKDVKEAVHVAYSLSEKGDVILLSPACASWDQYKTFEIRGNMFIEAVHILT